MLLMEIDSEEFRDTDIATFELKRRMKYISSQNKSRPKIEKSSIDL